MDMGKGFALVVILVFSLLFNLSIKPISADSGTTQIYFGAFVGPSHIDAPAQFAAFGTKVGKGLAIWENFQYWDRPADPENDPNFDTAWMDSCRSYGAIPLVTWDPGDGGEEFYAYLPLIIAGNYDSYINTWAQAAKDWGHPFFIRFLHQTLYGFPNDTASQYAQAWIHVHNIFKSVGATNVSWIWSPSFFDINSYSAAYPGDSYVDWTGMAGYNWRDSTTFDQMFNSNYQANLNVAPTKPQMITEVGFGESRYKAGLFTDMLKFQLPNNYPDVKALVYWEGHIGKDDSNDVESNPNALTAFQQGIALNYYSSNVYANLNVSPLDALSGSVSTPAPMLVPTSTPVPSGSGFGFADLAIVVVVGAIVVVAVAQKISQKK